jgi:hypothetical protein
MDPKRTGFGPEGIREFFFGFREAGPLIFGAIFEVFDAKAGRNADRKCEI